MLLAIDISNTNIKLGLYQSETMEHHWIISTVRQRTCDEYAMVIKDLLQHINYTFANIDDVIISCVVPSLSPVFQDLALRYCDKEALLINHKLDLGVRMLVDNPWEVGVDRIMTALAAHHLYGGPAIVIAFSTATTFDVVSAQGDFLGGAIAPGLFISAEALSSAAAQLFRVEMKPPRSASWAKTLLRICSRVSSTVMLV